MRVVAFLALAVVAVALTVSTFYSVEHAEFAYVTQFGRPIVVRDGADDAGLHVKWPWPVQSVQRLDRRLQMFDLPPAELPTYDPSGRTIDKMLTVDAFVCWRVPDAEAADRFVRTVGTPERAQAILGPRVAARIGAVVGAKSLDELIHVEAPLGAMAVGGSPAVLLPRGPASRNRSLDARAAKLREELLDDDLGASVREEYGIALVDVRIRRINYPDTVRPAIFERIRSERKRKAADAETDGERKARDIRSAAERDAEIARANATAAAERVKRQADSDADRIRNQAHALDRDFYTFLQQLEAFRLMLAKSNDTMLLSSKHPLFKLMFNPPANAPKSERPEPPPRTDR